MSRAPEISTNHDVTELGDVSVAEATANALAALVVRAASQIDPLLAAIETKALPDDELCLQSRATITDEDDTPLITVLMILRKPRPEDIAEMERNKVVTAGGGSA